MLTDLLLYSLRNLKNRKLRTWLTMLGIIIGIASVVALISLGNGLRVAIIGQFGSAGPDVLTIQAGGAAGAGPPGTGVVNPLLQEQIPEVDKLPSVDIAFGRVLESLKVEFNDIQDINFAASMPDGESRGEVEEIIALEPLDGRLLKDGDNGRVVLGANFLDDDNDFGRAIRAGDRVLINDKTFEVVGITKKKGSFIFDNIIWMNEEPLRDLSGNEEEVAVIIAKAKSINDVDKAKDEIERYFRKEREVKEGEEDFTVQTAQSTLQTVDGILGGIQAFVIIIASISMLVGSIGIVNTMFTSVLERKKEIGIMKAIGATNLDIFMLFFFESGLLGLVGGTIGIIIGSFFAILGINAMNSLLGITGSADISVGLIFFSLLGSFILGSFSGIVPAMQAARLPPVEALRS